MPNPHHKILSMEHPYLHNLKSIVPFQYFMMRFTAIQCVVPTYDMDWLILFTHLFDVQRIIYLAFTKSFVNEEWLNTVISCPRWLFELVHSFLEFAQKVLFPLLYKPLQFIHVDLYLQYSIKSVVFTSIW